MDTSNSNTEEQGKIESELLSKAQFSNDDLVLNTEGKQFIEELKHFARVYVIKLKVKPFEDILWGSMGMYQFTNELLNNLSFKSAVKELLPFEGYYELKKDIATGGNLFNLLGDLCGLLKQGGCYGSGSDLKNDVLINITKQFIDQNLRDGYKMYHYIKINEPWTKWFGPQPIYSLTYLLINLYQDEMLMICIADDD